MVAMKSQILIIRLTEKQKLKIKKHSRPYPSLSHYVLSAERKAWRFRELIDQAMEIERKAERQFVNTPKMKVIAL